MGTIRKKAVFAVLCVVLGSAIPAAPAVLQEMPADAGFILVTEPLADLSVKLDLLGHQLGVLPPEQPFDLTALLSANLGISGIDPTRGIGLAAPNILAMQEGVILYLPVQDAKAAMESLKTTSEAIPLVSQEDTLRIPGPGVCVKASGQYLMASENAEMLAAVSQMAKGAKLNAESQKIFESSQCAFRMDIKPLVPMIQALAENPGALSAMAGAGMGVPGGGMTPDQEISASTKAIQQMAFARLSEVELLAGGIQLGQDGITMATHAQSQPGSKLAAFLTQKSSADISKFKTLPDGVFNWAMAIDMDAEAFVPMIKGFINAVAGDPVAVEKIGKENLAALSELLPNLVTSHGCMADYAPGTAATGAATTPSMMKAWITDDNAIEKVDMMQKAVPLITGIMSAMGNPVTIDYKIASGTVADRPYDEIVTDMSQMQMAPEQQQMLMAQWGGKLSMSMYLCRVDMHNIAYSMDPGHLKELVEFSLSNQPGLEQNADMVKTAAFLPKNANVYFFIQPGNFVRSTLAKMPPTMSMIFGMFSQLPGMIGSSVTMQNGQINSQTYIPNDFIQSLVTMTMQMQQQMQQPPPGMYGPPPGQSDSANPPY